MGIIYFSLQEMLVPLQRLRELTEEYEYLQIENTKLWEQIGDEPAQRNFTCDVADVNFGKQVKFTWGQMVPLIQKTKEMNRRIETLKKENERLKMVLDCKDDSELAFFDSHRRPKTIGTMKNGLVL